MSLTEITHIDKIRHSLAHLLAATVIEMYPGAKNAIGPAIEKGFYQDFETPTPITEDDLSKIEAKMRKELKTWAQFQRREVTPEEAREEFAWNPYKLELIDEFASAGNKQITFYTSGSFTDLCKGGHVEDAKEINPEAFKLTKVSGAYWRGDQNRQQLQRIYGVAFETKDELGHYLQQLEEAKLRDHRRLGQELDLFTLSDLVGPGLPLFTVRGTILRNMLTNYSEQLQREKGYEAVWAPHMTRVELYKTSGHFDKYPERFDVSSVESDDAFMLKPMNCPHVTQIYASRPRSYRDLPLRYMETTTMYRDEKSGELHGLSRVRSLTQDDAHAFVRHDQIEDEMRSVISMVKQMYTTLDMKLNVDLSFRDDTDNYFGDPELWKRAQSIMEQVAKEQELNYRVEVGEAAFYGPKIDIYVSDALSRRWQCATVQLDFIMPERFKLEYTAEDGNKHRPAMIHKAILGSIERFLSVYIEHTGGWFPFWMAPEQIRILTINDSVFDYVEEIEGVIRNTILMHPVKYNELRFTRDDRNESLGKKIREATAWKIPVQLIVGPKDKEAREVSVRTQSGEEKVSLEKLAEYLTRL